MSSGRGGRRFAGGLAAAVCAGILAAGCGAPDEPAVELRAGDGWQAAAVTGYDVDGARDGDRTRVDVVYTLADGARLHLELRVFFDPRPVLESGTWRREQEGPSGAQAGEVKAESLRFTGGQNEGPSLGGRFRLDGPDGPRYRVVMPLRPVREPRW